VFENPEDRNLVAPDHRFGSHEPMNESKSRWALVVLCVWLVVSGAGCSRCLAHDTQYFFDGSQVVSRNVCTQSECRKNYVKNRFGDCVSKKRHERRVERRAARKAK
jgi:hypothetical protein